MIRFVNSRLSYKVAVAASALTLSFVLVMGGAAWMVMSSLTRNQVDDLLRSEAGLRAEKVADLVEGITASLHTLANNPAVAGAIAGGRSNDPFLVSLLAGAAELNGVPTFVTALDERGRVMAGVAPAGDGGWIDEALALGRARARFVNGPRGPALTVAQPVVMRLAGRVVGALLYQVALGDLARRASSLSGGAGELVLFDGALRHTVDLGLRLDDHYPLVAEAAVRLPKELQPFRLMVRVGAEKAVLEASLQRLTSLFLLIGAASVFLVVVVAVLMGERLTVALSRLSDAATNYAFGHGDRAAFRIGGKDEIARLGSAFEGMVERLDRAYQDLERRSQTLLSNAERVAQVGSAVWDLRSGRQVWSDQFHAILGLVPDDVHAGREPFFDRVHPDDRQRVAGAIEDAVKGEGRVEEDFRIVRADGDERVAQMRGEVARDEAGKALRIDLTLQDITERKHMEDKLDGLVRDLRRSNEELEQFAYVASHDLRQPLRVVGSYVTLIEEAIEDKLDGETREFMDFIRDGVRRMDLLITDLLAYSRVGRTSKDGPVDTGRAMDLALIDLQVEIDGSGARIRQDGRMPVVRGDTSEMTRLFQNLIGNAVKYRAVDRPSEVIVGCADKGPLWEFHVADNGIGIPAEHMQRVFGIFQRLHARDEYEGTGIGLAICKKVVERHGGRIWAEPSPGGGTTFRFTWPKMKRMPETAGVD
ncbi:MAG: ATP-binding protein [Solirubrobacterales bacterium]